MYSIHFSILLEQQIKIIEVIYIYIYIYIVKSLKNKILLYLLPLVFETNTCRDVRMVGNEWDRKK